ncbi:hypothetical protein SLE2022_162750 [Rubroshorea leprosula]
MNCLLKGVGRAHTIRQDSGGCHGWEPEPVPRDLCTHGTQVRVESPLIQYPSVCVISSNGSESSNQYAQILQFARAKA